MKAIKRKKCLHKFQQRPTKLHHVNIILASDIVLYSYNLLAVFFPSELLIPFISYPDPISFIAGAFRIND